MFYLKEPKSKNKTLIIVQYYVAKNKAKFKLSTNIKINPENWDKKSIVNEFFKIIPGFNYHDSGKYLDGKM